jgi:hypothetical protein
MILMNKRIFKNLQYKFQQAYIIGIFVLLFAALIIFIPKLNTAYDLQFHNNNQTYMHIIFIKHRL